MAGGGGGGGSLRSAKTFEDEDDDDGYNIDSEYLEEEDYSKKEVDCN